MILTLVAAIAAIVIATGVIVFWRRGLDGFRRGSREVRPEGPNRGDGRGGPVSLDALPNTARVMSTTTPPAQAGLGKLPSIKAPPAGRAERAERTERRAERRRGLLPADAVITFADERKAAAIDDVFAALDRELVGLVPVKKQVEEIGSLLLVDRVRQRFGLLAPRPNLHMCFTGAPGTGKTTVGLLMADLLHQLGYLERGQLVHAMRDDMVGEFVGQTAPKTRRVLEKAMGGVLFIDEASALYQPDNSKDFGLEAIETLLQVMENERDKLIVILAGYKDRMDTFFESNPGLRSRIAHHMDFADYDIDELVAIGRVMLERASYYLSDSGEAAFREYLSLRMQQPLFANARSVRNELERARLRHAHRLAADRQRRWNRDDLMRIEADDIFGGRVFSAPGVIGPRIS
jgi:probable Rubsico expression protein CbbX